jgi:nitronate monooxygenase
MALVTGGRLAAAVSGAGGHGIVGGGYAGILGGEPDLRQEMAHVRGHKFGVGLITWALARAPHVLDETMNQSPDYVFLSFGDPP